uniref:Abhydrolase_3 domain-containing protein n=1 Tax=Rhabditophanes sp. KR3021 TaxID=114890 RepID=A0AC35U1X1_9BILA
MKFRRFFTTINHPQTKFMPNCLITTQIIGNLSCRIYKPLTIKEHSFNLIYYHGGGFCLFSPGDYDKLMVSFIEQFNCHIISLDYPLSPESVFPQAINETYNTTSIIMSSLGKYALDSEANFVAGDSAGGCMVAVVTQTAAQQGHNWFKGQILIYPFLGSFNYQSPSYQQFPHFEYKSILSPRLMAEFVLIYLGVPCNKQNTDAILQSSSMVPTFDDNCPLNQFANDPLVSPVIANFNVLQNVPSSLTLLAPNDVLKDEGLFYATNMKKAAQSKSDITHKVLMHQCMTHGECSFSSQAIADITHAVSIWLTQIGTITSTKEKTDQVSNNNQQYNRFQEII